MGHPNILGKAKSCNFQTNVANFRQNYSDSGNCDFPTEEMIGAQEISILALNLAKTRVHNCKF